MKLTDLEIYQLAMKLGEKIWHSVNSWDYFIKDSLGKQFIRACDSIALNIAEGFGRFSYNETKQFSYYARGSLFETQTCIQKAYNRNLIDEVKYRELLDDVKNLGVKLNNYITYLRNQTGK